MATTSLGGVRREKLALDSLTHEIRKLGDFIERVDWTLYVMDFDYKLKVLFSVEGQPYTRQRSIKEEIVTERAALRGIYEEVKAAIQQKINEVYDEQLTEEEELRFRSTWAGLRVYGYAPISRLHPGF